MIETEKPSSSRGRVVERERDHFRFVRSQHNGLIEWLVSFVPRFDRVGGGRKVLQREDSVPRSHGKIWLIEDKEVAPHPRMNHAPDRNGEFGVLKSEFEGKRTGKLRCVPPRVVPQHCVNIMQDGIAVCYFKRLTNHQREDTWRVHAIFLVEDRGVLPCWVAITAKPGFHINDDVCERAVCASHDDWRRRWRGFGIRAGRRTTHVDGAELRGSALKLN